MCRIVEYFRFFAVSLIFMIFNEFSVFLEKIFDLPVFFFSLLFAPGLTPFLLSWVLISPGLDGTGIPPTVTEMRLDLTAIVLKAALFFSFDNAILKLERYIFFSIEMVPN